MSDSLPYLFIRDLTVVLIAACCAAAACKRIKLSPIVGYLLAGVIVGSPQITFVYVTDAASVQVLSQLGLIFLMFTIGLSLRIQKIKQIGLHLIGATIVTALIVLSLSRPAAHAIGMDSSQALFFAAMITVSSSAIIAKSLQSMDLLHKRSGQLALAITLCEDIVAIVMLVFLGSYAAMGSERGGWYELASQVGGLFAFATLLLIPGLALVPKLLKRVGQLKSDGAEIENIAVGALLLSMAIITLLSGYSLAFGAFLCGVIVAEAASVERIAASFSGLKDLFVAIFFVAIGMQVDITQFGSAIGPIALGTLLALLLRPLAALASLLLFCETPKNAITASGSITPIGEFSFVIANLGIAAGALDSSFQVAAVGIAFLTALLSPLSLQGSRWIAEKLQKKPLGPARRILESYRELWADAGRQGDASLLWRLIRKRIPQVSIEFAFASALLLFSRPLAAELRSSVEQSFPEWQDPVQIAYWSLVALLALVVLLALSRNLNALSMIVADSLFGGKTALAKLKRPLELSLRSFSLGALGLWILNIAPLEDLGIYSLLAVVLLVTLMLIFGWRHMVRLHSEVTISLNETINQESASNASARYLQQAKVEWDLELEEWTVTSLAHFGKSIGDLEIRKRTGANIVGIERQGHYLAAVGPSTYLSPGDRIYATGSPEQLSAMRELLSSPSEDQPASSRDYSLAILQSAMVESGSPVEGATLRDLGWPRLYGVQVVSLKSGDQAPANPDVDRPLKAGDILLLVGTPLCLKQTQKLLRPPPSAEGH